MLLLLASFSVSRAQWTTQEISLQPGWNPVYLSVQPDPASCDIVFSNAPFQIISASAYENSFSSFEFVDDQDVTFDVDPEWLTWVPTDNSGSFGRTLFSLHAGNAYFIRLPSDAEPVTWTVTGKALLRPVDWKPNAFNLVGFSLGDIPPTFAQFFGPSPELANRPLYRMLSNGTWRRVIDPAAETMRDREAFWVALDGPSTYQGPVRLEMVQRDGLDFDQLLSEQTFTIHNQAATPVTVKVTRRSSLPTPSGSEDPARAGDVPLASWHADLGAGTWGWDPLNQVEYTIPGKGSQEVRLQVQRKLMVPLQPPLGQNYQSLLHIEDVGGSFHHVMPVVSRGLEVFDEDGNPRHPYTGMWVGYAHVTHVSQPAHISDPELPRPTPNGLDMRLILHADTNGIARLLPWAIEMWKDGRYAPEPGNPENQVVVEPGRYVWLTDQSLIPQFKGVVGRDGEFVGRRVSSVSFSFREPLLLTGPSDFGANTLSAMINTASDDALNPFLHRYHPDHDNVNPAGQTVEEAFAFTREITLEFTADDPEGLTLASWCDTQLGGIYRERITGVHRDPIFIEGIFRLNLTSRVGVLNDGL